MSRERASIEKTVESYIEWLNLDKERISLIEMERDDDTDNELKDIVRQEQKQITITQEILEKEITLLLLPRDPNDDRNVMLEIRAGTGGDEASIWAGDLVTLYRKYADTEGWKITTMSEAMGESGGYKTCIMQITGDFVYSKLKYEAGVHRVQVCFFILLFKFIDFLANFISFNFTCFPLDLITFSFNSFVL